MLKLLCPKSVYRYRKQPVSTPGRPDLRSSFDFILFKSHDLGLSFDLELFYEDKDEIRSYQINFSQKSVVCCYFFLYRKITFSQSIFWKQQGITELIFIFIFQRFRFFIAVIFDSRNSVALLELEIQSNFR